MPDIPSARRWLYTNADNDWPKDEYFRLQMDTWYYLDTSLLAPLSNGSRVGSIALGDAPARLDGGVTRFIVQQVAALSHAFSDWLQPYPVVCMFRPQIQQTVWHTYSWRLPKTEADLQEIASQIESSPTSSVFTSLSMVYNLPAVVRDEHGQLHKTWLPEAGEFWYHVDIKPGSRLTPLVHDGLATWTVDFDCRFLSLFRPNNAEVLAHVRASWKRWLARHPDRQAVPRWQDEDDRDAAWYDTLVLMLADPPPESPPDNAELCDHNRPQLLHAVEQWQQEVGKPFIWATFHEQYPADM